MLVALVALWICVLHYMWMIRRYNHMNVRNVEQKLSVDPLSKLAKSGSVVAGLPVISGRRADDPLVPRTKGKRDWVF